MRVDSPCISVCKIENGICAGCNRTLHEISQWSKLDMSDRMELMKELSGQVSTHTCPKCKGPSYCAIEDGKSASTCWCMTLTVSKVETVSDEDVCLCRSCLRMLE